MSGLDLTGEHDDDPPAPLEPDAPPDEPGKTKRRRARRKSSSSSSSPRPPRKATTEADLRKRIEDGLGEVVAFMRDRLEWDDVARTMSEDQKRMAEVLAARATKHARLAAALTRLFGRDSALSFARAFGPTLRAASAQFHAWRLTRVGGVLVDSEGYVVDPVSGERTGERVDPATGERVSVG